MSVKWTKAEEKVLTDYMGGRRVLYWRDKLAIRELLPNRSASAIEKRWAILLKPKAEAPLLQYNPVDVAFCKKITETDIIRHFRDQGLRRTVHLVLELGE